MNVHIIVLTETWLNESVLDSEILDNRYQIFRRDRQSGTFSGGREGGGVLIAVIKSINAYRNKSFESCCEDLWVTLDLPTNSTLKTSKRIHLCATYLAPPVNINLITYFTNKVSSAINDDSVIIIGDFNLGNIKWTKSSAHQHAEPNVDTNNIGKVFLEFLSSNDLYQYNAIENKQNRILDLVISNLIYPIKVTRSCDVISKVDDFHPPLQIAIHLNLPKPLTNKKTMIYKFKNADYHKIRKRLEEINWNIVLKSDTIDTAVDNFYLVLREIIAESVPRRSAIKNLYPIWYNSNLIKMLKEKEKCRQRMKKYKNKRDEYEYLLLKDRSSRKIKELYQKYLQNVQNNIIKNPKYFWSYIKNKRDAKSIIPRHMRLNNSTATDGLSIADLFAENFASVYSPISNIVPNPTYIHNTCNSNNLHHVTLSKTSIQRKLKNLDIAKGSGSDGIPPLFIRECAELLSEPLCMIFNRSLSEGIFPRIWKEAIVIPILKSGDKTDICNYRPISILPTLAKVFESLLCPILNWHIKSSITEHQHGFFRNRSTATNLVTFVERTLAYMSNGKEVDAVYSDFSKAFDKVDHGVLLQKLETTFGVHGPLLKWFESYLVGRTARVVVNGHSSRSFAPTSGVPQGSHLGPVLFNMFIDDIKHSIRNSHFEMYADDLKLYRVVMTKHDESLLQEDIDRLCVWCEKNSMMMNVAKCYHVKFSRKKHKFDSSYKMNNQVLSKVSEVKDLGITIDSEMKFNTHTDLTINKSNRMLAFLNRSTKQFRNLAALKTLFFALVRSHIEYCSIVWYPVHKIHIERIERIQIKFIKRLSYIAGIKKAIKDYEDRLKHFKMNSLHWRRKFAGLMFLFKILNQRVDCPTLLASININIPRTSARLHNYKPFAPSGRKTKYGSNAPLTYILRHCNEIFHDCNFDIFSNSLNSFKKSVLTHM